MKVHSDTFVQMTHGHGTKVTQITYLIAPCWRALWDDRNGHLDDPIRSLDIKVMPPGKSQTWPCQAGRPSTFLNSLSTQYHCIGDSPMDPQALGYMPKAKLRPKDLICPSNGLPKATRCWAGHPRLDLHLHANKHKENQCQPLDGS
jgi:hypothetical protein